MNNQQPIKSLESIFYWEKLPHNYGSKHGQDKRKAFQWALFLYSKRQFQPWAGPKHKLP